MNAPHARPRHAAARSARIRYIGALAGETVFLLVLIVAVVVAAGLAR